MEARCFMFVPARRLIGSEAKWLAVRGIIQQQAAKTDRHNSQSAGLVIESCAASVAGAWLMRKGRYRPCLVVNWKKGYTRTWRAK